MTQNPSPRILLACFPKSGSTLLSHLIGNLPGIQRQDLIPGYGRREQELCADSIKTAIRRSPGGFVGQHHIRFSETTGKLLNKFDMTAIILVRDIFDVVISIRDHIIMTRSSEFPMAYLDSSVYEWPQERLESFIADMVVPWYFNFFLSWHDYEHAKWITYNDLIQGFDKQLHQVATFANIPCNKKDIETALHGAKKTNTRKNKGINGRGQALHPDIRKTILHYASYYPEIDFSMIGITDNT